jgi:hypothetical protein
MKQPGLAVLHLLGEGEIRPSPLARVILIATLESNWMQHLPKKLGAQHAHEILSFWSACRALSFKIVSVVQDRGAIR